VPFCLLNVQFWYCPQSLSFTQVSLAVWQWYVPPHQPSWLNEQKLPGPQSESTRQSLPAKQVFADSLEAELRQSQGVLAGQSASLKHVS